MSRGRGRGGDGLGPGDCPRKWGREARLPPPVGRKGCGLWEGDHGEVGRGAVSMLL